ncbi:solute carrier organic anion transporter family member 1A2 [Platysternon megacephalum]|uniref:Solute carrier organic anion transporter family member 1A2 n=1 Tax=Platysternon megacephalum TaxID=55544 RepID=A0A4D9ELH9_9SAUR|nr:solute carrier organic anion transporter family member 1A2 [Platysternon megacephalum]
MGSSGSGLDTCVFRSCEAIACQGVKENPFHGAVTLCSSLRRSMCPYVCRVLGWVSFQVNVCMFLCTCMSMCLSGCTSLGTRGFVHVTLGVFAWECRYVVHMKVNIHVLIAA